jgi:hypothetical protein
MTGHDPFAPPPSGDEPPQYPPPYQPPYQPPSQPYGPQQPMVQLGYGYPPPPMAYGYPPAPRGHGKAIAGLVLGIVALVFCWFPFLDVPVWTAGLVFAILGLSDAKKGAGGRGLSIAGLTCAILATVANIAITVLIFVVGFTSNQSCANTYGVGTSQYDNCVGN